MSDIETSDDGADFEHLINESVCVVIDGVESDDVIVKANDGGEYSVISMDDLAYLRRIAVPEMLGDMEKRLRDSEEHAAEDAIPDVAEDAASLLAGIRELLKMLDNPNRQTTFRMSNAGKNPGGYTIEASRCGDMDIYDEMRVSILDKNGDCVGDALIGLSESGEPRVLVTADGDGSGDHKIAAFPMRAADTAVELFDGTGTALKP